MDGKKIKNIKNSLNIYVIFFIYIYVVYNKMITASFAKPVGLFDNWFNKVTAYVTGGEFCHSEFIFSFSTL